MARLEAPSAPPARRIRPCRRPAPVAPQAAPARRGPKIVAALVSGPSVKAIAESERLTHSGSRRCCATAQAALGRAGGGLRAPADRRLEAIAAKLAPSAEEGELGDRPPAEDPRPLDRYHGFSKLAPAERGPDEAAARACCRLNAMAGSRSPRPRPSNRRAREAHAGRAHRAAAAGATAGRRRCSQHRRAARPIWLAEHGQQLGRAQQQQCKKALLRLVALGADDQRPPPGD